MLNKNVLNSCAFICLLLLTTLKLSAQDSKADIKSGNIAFENDDFGEAMPIYERLVKLQPDNALYQYRLGVCYESQLEYHKAKIHLDKALAINEEIDKEFHYWYGEVEHHLHEWDKAKASYEKYVSTLNHKDAHIKTARLHLKQIEIARDLFSKRTNHRVKNLGEFVNSELGEHSPIISMDNNRLIFTMIIREIQDGEEILSEKIVESHRESDGTWSQPKALEGALNDVEHQASVQLFENDTKMLIYQPINWGDLFISELKDGKWSEPQPIKAINTKYSEADASITEDGKTLYYTTDRFGKDGHLDIYFSNRSEDGVWSTPKSVGEHINSDYDEIAPFISRDGSSLYFCNNGPLSMGEYDVFQCKKMADGSWSKPINMGYPINSTENDVYYHLSEDGSRTFLASYRVEGYGLLDIYEVEEMDEISLEMAVKDAEENPLPNGFTLSITSDKDAWRNVKHEIPVVNGRVSIKLPADITYKFEVKGEGKSWGTKNINVATSSSLSSELITSYLKTPEVAAAKPEKEATESKTRISESKTKINETLLLQFGYNITGIENSSAKTLDGLIKKLKGVEDLQITIVGHTDNIGSTSFNKELSKNRALEVKQTLIRKGISSNNISIIAEGESNPLAPNDTEAGRAKNRRVEIKVTGTL